MRKWRRNEIDLEYYANGFVTTLPDTIDSIKLKLKDGKVIHIIENEKGVNIDWGDKE